MEKNQGSKRVKLFLFVAIAILVLLAVVTLVQVININIKKHNELLKQQELTRLYEQREYNESLKNSQQVSK